jgi:hypothetical protein
MLWSSGEAEVGDAKSLILNTRGISGDSRSWEKLKH